MQTLNAFRILLLGFIITSSLADDRQCGVNGTVEPWANGRFYLYNTDGETIADLVKKDDEWSEAASKIIQFAKDIGQKRIDEGRYLRCLKHDGLAETEFPIANEKLENWGFGSLEKCVVDIEWDIKTKTQEKKLARNIFPHLETFDAKLISGVTAEILQKYNGVPKENWTSIDSISQFETEGPSGLLKCKVFKLFAIKHDLEWNLDAAFTNFDKNIELPNFDRWYGGELLEFKGLEVQSSRTRTLTSCDIFGNANPTINGTFGTEVWEGRPSSHVFITEKTEDNRGIQKALERSSLRAELVSESRLASSIAVLFLPSVLALLPVSLFQEVSLATGFVYSIATDVISIIPVTIKGIELIYFGTNKQWAIHTRFYGGANETEPAAAIHWISHCEMKSRILVQGVIYLVVGLFLMILGLLLEIFAAKRLQFLKTKWFQDNSEDPHAIITENAGLLWHWRESDRSKGNKSSLTD